MSECDAAFTKSSTEQLWEVSFSIDSCVNYLAQHPPAPAPSGDPVRGSSEPLILWMENFPHLPGQLLLIFQASAQVS